MTRLTTGPRHPWNLSIDAKGSIHDDATANDLGFRAGTVAGDIHLEQFGGLCREAFGDTWFETGWISMNFLQPTAHREPVDAFVDGDGTMRDAGIDTPEGAQIARGNAGIGDASKSALSIKDRRGVDPSSLRMLCDVRRGQSTDQRRRAPFGADQHRRLEAGICTDPLEWYGDSSPWGGGIASPLTTCQLLVAGVTDTIAASCGEFVGLYGAIEVRYLNGPVRLDAEYDITGEVLDVADSPKTEVLWFRTRAVEVARPDRGPVAEVTMMTRLLKASSPRWA